MPKHSLDYSQIIMYKIVSNDLAITDCYVGSTSNFVKRKTKHKSYCKTSNCKIYQFIRANGGWDSFTMVEIEKYPCQDGNEARARERYWYETLNSTLNTDVPNRSKAEWWKTNPDKVKIILKRWRDKNRDKISEYQREWYLKKKETQAILEASKYVGVLTAGEVPVNEKNPVK